MNANRRKPLLIAALGLIAVFVAGDWVNTNWIEAPKKKRLTQINALNTKIREYDQKYIARAQQTLPWLRYWYSQSLPSNPAVAQSLYRAWLLEMGEYVGIAGRNVSATEPVRRGVFYSMNFSFRGRATPEQLTQFLYEFYSAGQLHKITSISLTPVERGSKVDISLVIETLIIPRANQTDRLSEGRAYPACLPLPRRLQRDRPAEFLRGRRGRGGRSRKPHLPDRRQLREQPTPGLVHPAHDGAVMRLNENDQLVQTGDTVRKLCQVEDLRNIVFDGSRSEIGSVREIDSGSVLVQAAGHIWEPTLSATGDSLEFRPFTSHVSVIGAVVDVQDTDVVLQTGDERWLLSIGDVLNDAFALPPEMN